MRLVAATALLFICTFPAIAADDKAEKPGKTKVVTQDQVLKSLEKNKEQASFTPRFQLTPPELTTLENLLSGLTEALEARGYYRDAHTMTLGMLATELVQRIFSTLPRNQTDLLPTLDYHPNGTVAQWLDDRGWSPEVLYVLFALTQGNTVDFKKLAEARGAENWEEYRDTPHLIPNSLSAPATVGMGSRQRDEGGRYLQRLAFELDGTGRPIAFDPSLINLQEHAKVLRYQLSVISLGRAETAFGRYRENFYDRTKRFSELMSIIESVELATYDLQGMLDAIKYKITLCENTLQVHQLNLILNRTLALRGNLVALGSRLFSIPNLETMPFKEAYRAVLAVGHSASQDLAAIRKSISKDIDLIDKVLSHDDTEEERFMHDTPFELKFKFDEKNAQQSDLVAHWNSVRTHQYKVKEIHKTAHWTTRETETDKDGKTTTKTVHHNTASTDWEYATMETPSVEMDMAEAIDGLHGRLVRADAAAVPRLRAEIEGLIKRQATYTQTEPSGAHDYSDKYLDRNRTLLKRLDALYEQSFIVEAKSGGKIQDFNRGTRILPKYVNPLLDFLKSQDKAFSRVRNITWGIAGGTVAAAGATWGLCHYLLGQGGGL